MLSCSVVDAQGRHKKSYIPPDDSDEYDTEIQEEVRMETQIQQNSSESAQKRMIKHREKRKEKETFKIGSGINN